MVEGVATWEYVACAGQTSESLGVAFAPCSYQYSVHDLRGGRREREGGRVLKKTAWNNNLPPNHTF